MNSPLSQKLQSLVNQPGVTDIVFNGAESCFIDLGLGMVEGPKVFASDQQLIEELIELGFQTGNRVDVSKPIADFMIDGNRFHAVLPFGVSNRPLLSIRVHPKDPIRLEHLREVGMLSEKQSKFITQAVLEKKNILVCGPTSSGKTTLLNAMLNQISERSICIEQTPELHIQTPAVSLFERSANQEGLGEVSLQQLVIESLRMRPDRIVVGEIRGSEFGVLLQAMNNGHSGCMATIHARDLQSVSKRILMLGSLSGLEPNITTDLVSGAVELVIQLERKAGQRRISQIGIFSNAGLELQEVPIEGDFQIGVTCVRRGAYEQSDRAIRLQSNEKVRRYFARQ